MDRRSVVRDSHGVSGNYGYRAGNVHTVGRLHRLQITESNHFAAVDCHLHSAVDRDGFLLLQNRLRTTKTRGRYRTVRVDTDNRFWVSHVTYDVVISDGQYAYFRGNLHILPIIGHVSEPETAVCIYC